MPNLYAVFFFFFYHRIHILFYSAQLFLTDYIKFTNPFCRIPQKKTLKLQFSTQFYIVFFLYNGTSKNHVIKKRIYYLTH